MTLKQTPSRLCFVAGKSGGHIIPCLTLAQQYINQYGSTPLLFFSTKTNLDKQLLNNHPLVTNHVMLTFGSTNQRVKELIRFIFSFFTSFYYLYKFKPQKIISTGGKITIPVCLAAKTLRIPFELYELNVIPGKTIKFLSRFAQTTFICFEKTRYYLPRVQCKKIEYPLRFNTKPTITSKEKDKKTILVLGGSQGSVFINTLIKKWLNSCPELHNQIFIIHQTGSYDPTNWQQFYVEKNISARAFTYDDDITNYYTACDLVICRSGAGTLFETMHFNKKCITIPLELKSTDHQLDNAQQMAHNYPELFTYIRQQEIDTNPESFFIKIKKNLEHNLPY